jgi:hypothetical protein
MEEQYSTKEEILQALRKKQNELGIVLSIKSSNQTRLVLKCDRGGSYINRLMLTDETRQRKTHTRLNDCPFLITCTSRKGIWAVRKMVDQHNHPVALDLSGHAVFKRPSGAAKERIHKLAEQRVAPKSILSVMREEFKDETITSGTIY